MADGAGGDTVIGNGPYSEEGGVTASGGSSNDGAGTEMAKGAGNGGRVSPERRRDILDKVLASLEPGEWGQAAVLQVRLENEVLCFRCRPLVGHGREQREKLVAQPAFFPWAGMGYLSSFVCVCLSMLVYSVLLRPDFLSAYTSSYVAAAQLLPMKAMTVFVFMATSLVSTFIASILLLWLGTQHLGAALALCVQVFCFFKGNKISSMERQHHEELVLKASAPLFCAWRQHKVCCAGRRLLLLSCRSVTR